MRGCGDGERGSCVPMMATQPWGLHLSCLWCHDTVRAFVVPMIPGKDVSSPHHWGYGGNTVILEMTLKIRTRYCEQERMAPKANVSK